MEMEMQAGKETEEERRGEERRWRIFVIAL
jgi:hypothetical protein